MAGGGNGAGASGGKQGASGVGGAAVATGPLTALAATFGFAEGYTGASFQEYLTLFNPATVAARVTPQPPCEMPARTARRPSTARCARPSVSR